MKKLLSITLLIIAVLLGSCKEESSISRIEKGTTKKVKALSYTFNSTQNEDSGTVKSGNSTDSTKVVSPIERKVISVDTWEEGGETFVASLIEENDPIATKAPTQEVNGSSVYTFYAYKDSKIKPQTVAPKGTFDVPVDKATNYGMIFLSSAKGMENPKQLTPTTIDESNKEITYKAAFNENVCYASFDKVKMPPGNPIDVTFTPVFSQLGIYVPSKVTGTTITVEKVRLVSGGQQEATVKVVYNSNATNNIDVTYNDNLANYAVDLTHKLNPADNITYLYPNGQYGYYNIIPNGKPAQVYIKMSAGGKTRGRTIAFKGKDSKPISFIRGKRYTIKVQNEVVTVQSITISPDPLSIVKGRTGTLTATVKMSDGSTPPTTGYTWSFSPTGVVTVTGSSTSNTISLKGASVGQTTATVTYGGKSVTATVKVTAAVVDEITLSPNPLSIVKGQTGTLKATVKMSDGSSAPTTGFTWRFSPTGVVTVTGRSTSNTISLKGASVGQTTATVTYGDKSVTATVKVTAAVVDRIELTPIDTENLDASYTTGNYVYKFGLQHKFKAEAVYSDNSRMEITTSAAWSANGATSDGGGVVTITSETPATVTATFRGKSANVTIKPLIWKRFTMSNYYQWDAVTPINGANPGFWNNWSNADAIHSCAHCLSYDDVQYILGDKDGHYRDANGLIYLLPDGKLYCKCYWFKRRNLCSGDKISGAPSYKQGRPPVNEFSKWFCLPFVGSFTYNSMDYFKTQEVRGLYWTKTCITPTNVNQAWMFIVQDDPPGLWHDARGWGAVPLIESNFYVN